MNDTDTALMLRDGMLVMLKLGGPPLLVALAVGMVEVGDLRMPEDECRQRTRPGRMERERSAGRVQHHDVATRIDALRQRQGRDVEPGVTDELRFRTESQPTHGRMQPIGADDQIETSRS